MKAWNLALFLLAQAVNLASVQAGEVGISNTNVTPLHQQGLYGNGISIGLFDAAWADWEHPDLMGRVIHDESLIDLSGFAIGNWGRKDSHPTHMAGVIAASGLNNPKAMGTAPASKIYSYYTPDNYLNSLDFMVSQSQLHGWRVSNHSYSNGWPCADPKTEPCKSNPLWSSYIKESRDMDTLAYSYNVLAISSAGNNGLLKNGSADFADDNWSTIYNGGTGKNAISVCAAAISPYAGYKFSLYIGSSKGPASDGRIKPDLCALGNGNPADLTTNLGGGYDVTYATSPSAAQVTAIVALLQEKYKVMYGSQSELPAELAKLVLIHTALDMHSGNAMWWNNGIYPVRGGAGPDYVTGWGYVDAGAAAKALEDANYKTDSISQTDSREYQVSVAAHTSLKVTLIWLDPPSLVGTGQALVNDLDLSVRTLDGSREYLPWVLDPAHPERPAATGVNSVDNVEQVVLYNDSSVARTYLVRIKGTQIPKGPQRFYLISNAKFASNIIVYATESTYDGNLGGRSGADLKCTMERVPSCAAGGEAHALLTLSTDDDLKHLQEHFKIPTDAAIVGSKGHALANSWSDFIDNPLPIELDRSTNLQAGSHFWSGSGVGGEAPSKLATSGSNYLCKGFTTNTKTFRGTLGKGSATAKAKSFSTGWDGGNSYPSCKTTLKLMCACW